MAKRTDLRVVIKEHRPWRGWLFSILLVTVSGATGWLLSFQPLPLLELGADGASPPPTLRPEGRLSYLQQENARLQEQLARTQRELEIEQHVRANLSANLAALQDQILELRRQLATYKGLAKSLEEQDLRIHDLTFSKTATERLLHYRLVLTQGRKMDQLTQGQVKFTLRGIVEGKPVRFEIDTLSKGTPLIFKFKYFQILRGELLLPRNFKPTRVKITLLPEDNPSQLVERTFDWSAIGG